LIPPGVLLGLKLVISLISFKMILVSPLNAAKLHN